MGQATVAAMNDQPIPVHALRIAAWGTDTHIQVDEDGNLSRWVILELFDGEIVHTFALRDDLAMHVGIDLIRNSTHEPDFQLIVPDIEP